MTNPIIATKQTVEEIFDGAAQQYDRVGPSFFRQFGARLVELMASPVGARVLDVGTGTGAVLAPLAQRVGIGGHVDGIDLSSAMLKQAERLVQEEGLTNVDLRKMDAEQLEFPEDSFDAITCGFSLFFFSSMSRALAEMSRVLKPGGQVAISIWNKEPAPFHPAWKIFADLVRRYEVEVRMPNKIAYSADEAQALMGAAGLQGIETRAETTEVIYTTLEDWWAFQLTMGSRAAILAMDEEKRARFKQDYLDELRSLMRTDGLHLPAPVIFAFASKF